MRELRKHRIVKFNDGEGAGSMEMLLSVLRPVMSYVSDEALEDALAIAGQARTARSAQSALSARSPRPDAQPDVEPEATAAVPASASIPAVDDPAQGRLL